jgi:N-acetylglutamate synthase-like GNAT family acetyltransferase
MDCVIRKATSKDATAISTIVVAALRVSNAKDYSSQIIDQVQQSFSPSQILSLLTLRQVYVASIGGHVIATGSLDGGTVRSVFVDPAYQRMGVGHRLMGAIESIAAQSGIRLLRVPSSITAEGFYYSLGFVKVRDEFHGDERTIIMEKLLS